MNVSVVVHVFTAALLISNLNASSCSSDDDDATSTSTPAPTAAPGTDCTGSYLVEAVNNYSQTGYPDPYMAVSCDEDFVIVESNGIPNFEFVQITPNALKEQDYTWHIPRHPEVAPAPTAIYTGGPVGIAVNGLSIYAPNEAANDGYKDPLLDGILDYCNGHTGPAGEYHFHARPECLFEKIDGQVHLVLGYAFDGFPIVAPFECTDAGCGSVKELKSSYVYVGGSTNAYQANQYQANAGDLDKCNGAVGPDGVYRYYATDTFPYLLGCFTGTPEASNNSAGGGGGPTPTPGPGACSQASDCTNACPSGSVGCTCAATPQGNQCVPTCTKDSDCPAGGQPPLTCDEKIGQCVPMGM